MSLTEDSVREALKQVIDPELCINIVDLGLVYTVDISQDEGPDGSGKSNVTVEMAMTTPACPAAPRLLQQSKDVLSRLEGVGEVEVKLVMTPPWTSDRMTEEARDQFGMF